jgi:hypothetical protein
MQMRMGIALQRREVKKIDETGFKNGMDERWRVSLEPFHLRCNGAARPGRSRGG